MIRLIPVPASPRKSHGRAMIAAWGKRARRRVAVCVERFNRCFNSIPEADRPTWQHWWRAMTPRERMSVYWVLGSIE